MFCISRQNAVSKFCCAVSDVESCNRIFFRVRMVFFLKKNVRSLLSCSFIRKKIVQGSALIINEINVMFKYVLRFGIVHFKLRQCIQNCRTQNCYIHSSANGLEAVWNAILLNMTRVLWNTKTKNLTMM